MMDVLVIVMSFTLGGNLFFAQGLGLEILSMPEDLSIPRLLRHGLWVFVVGVTLAAIGQLIPNELSLLEPLILPLLALAIWAVAANTAGSTPTFTFFLLQSAALGAAYLALSFDTWSETFAVVFFSAVGYILALLIYREVLRFVPAHIPPARRFSLLMLSMMVGSIGFLLFGARSPVG